MEKELEQFKPVSSWVYTLFHSVPQCVHRRTYKFKLLEFFSILSCVAWLKDIEKVNNQSNQHVVYTDSTSTLSALDLINSESLNK